MDSKLVINSSKGVLSITTGMFTYIAGYIQKKWSSAVGLQGVIKNVGFIFLVLIAILTDYVIVKLRAKIGIEIGFIGVFIFAVRCWLISTELLSIIENLGQMGVPILKFLRIAFTKLKDVSYVHLREVPKLKPGQKVEVGKVVAYSGNTGHTTALYLHIEVHEKWI